MLSHLKEIIPYSGGLYTKQVLDYLFPVLTAKEQWPVKGQKETSRTYCKQRGTCLSVFNIRKAPMLKVSRHLHLFHCFQEGMVVFDGPMV